MNEELSGYLGQIEAVKREGNAILAGMTDVQFNWRPGPERWSMAQCFDHLNVAVGRTFPAFDRAIADARDRGLRAPGPFPVDGGFDGAAREAAAANLQDLCAGTGDPPRRHAGGVPGRAGSAGRPGPHGGRAGPEAAARDLTGEPLAASAARGVLRFRDCPRSPAPLAGPQRARGAGFSWRTACAVDAQAPKGGGRAGERL